MPVYEYVCAPCRTRFERYVQRFNDAVQCPTCQGSEVEKQLSTFALGSAPGAPRAERAAGGCCAAGCGCRPA